jgi:hypothetical protein
MHITTLSPPDGHQFRKKNATHPKPVDQIHLMAGTMKEKLLSATLSFHITPQKRHG